MWKRVLLLVCIILNVEVNEAISWQMPQAEDPDVDPIIFGSNPDHILEVAPDFLNDDDRIPTDNEDNVDRLPPKDISCLEEKGDQDCTRKMASIKRTLKRAILNDCLRCSEAEKVAAGYVLASLVFYKPQVWKSLLTRYDGVERFQKYVRD